MAAAVSHFDDEVAKHADSRQDTLYEVMTLMVMKGPLSVMGSGKKETAEL
jgi:hypothetical protein